MSETWSVRVDQEICVGHGQCFARAADAYESDEDGFCVVRAAEVSGPLLEQARAGAEACPERAIAVGRVSL